MKESLLYILILFYSFTAASTEGEALVYRSVEAKAFELPEGVSGLKVFWWNIGCSSTKGLRDLAKDVRPKFDPVNQWGNIEALIVDENLRPDVLILGEYCPSAFRQKTYDKLKATYSNIYRLDKSNDLFNIRNGVRVFSKYKIKVLEESVLKSGEFLQEPYMKRCEVQNNGSVKKSYFNQDFWDRKLIELEITKNQKTYKLSPVHLANPWKFINSCSNKFVAGVELLSGTVNPNYFQVGELSNYFSEQESTILIGDFNAPKVFYAGVSSNSYTGLERAFGGSVVESFDYTYFHPRGSFGPYSLDHAFVSGDLEVKYGEVLNFAGSDHLPIYIIVE